MPHNETSSKRVGNPGGRWCGQLNSRCHVDGAVAKGGGDVTGDVVGMTSGAKERSDSSGGDDAVSIGVEEEFHVVDLKTRELVAGGPGLLERLPDESFGAE